MSDTEFSQIWPEWAEVEQGIINNVHRKTVGYESYEELVDCGKVVIQSNSRLSSDIETRIELLIIHAWEHLNTGHWKEVSLSWRYQYAYANLLKAKTVIDQSRNIESALRCIDLAILMGAPILDGVLPGIATRIHEYWGESKNFEPDILEREDIHHENIPNLPISVSENQGKLKIFENLSIAEFMTKHLNQQVPCIIKGLAVQWPAFSKWKDKSYFRKTCGHRTVPVEIGSRYTDSDWGQKLMTVSRFIDDHVNTQGNKGYLAQHQLLDQIVELRKDIVVPDFCFVNLEDDDDDEETRVEINAWFGPTTVSPLHQDPKDNILVQIVGRKYVHLFDIQETEFMYPYAEDQLLSNTSQIDLLNVDLERFPKFAKATSGLSGVLEPGDALYIPKKWWHFVSSLSSWSCSVSFWF